jgi:DNA-directed RNA polymerase specialized sigma24 family protein
MAGGVSHGAFNRLLTALDADRDRAAHAYELLRQRTIGLLRWWGAAEAEDLADIALDRVARKLDEGAVVAPGSMGAYLRGVARMIFYESRRRPQVLAHEVPLVTPAPHDTGPLSCLDSCLDRLPRQDRDLVLRYYAEGKAADVRRRLASDLALTMTALRIRAHRIRVQLEACVLACRSAP